MLETNIVSKGKYILENNYKMSNPNLLSMQLGQLEKEVTDMNMIRYLALASIDEKKHNLAKLDKE